MDRQSLWIRFARGGAIAALIAGLIAVVLNRDAIDPAAIVAWAEHHTWWESVGAFLLLHIVGSLFFIPRLFMGAAAGALFGPWAGTAIALAGATIGGMLGFWTVRFANADSVRLREAPAIGPWLERAETQGWRLVLVARLVPMLPHSLANYVFGLSRISSGAFALGSFLGMVPSAVVFVNLGATGRDLSNGTGDYWLMAVWGLGLIFISWLLPKLIQRIAPLSPRAPAPAPRRSSDAGSSTT